MAQAWDAVVLAGGTSRRLRHSADLSGTGDKTDVLLGGRTLLEHVLTGCVGASAVHVVGPVRPVRLQVAPAWCRETPPRSGPLAAVAAGVRAGGSSPTVVLLGGDMPFVGGAVPVLLAALTGSSFEAAALGRRGGAGGPGGSEVHPLAAAFRRSALARCLRDLGSLEGRPLRTLTARLRVLAVPDEGAWAADVDTPQDLLQARARLSTVTS